MSLTPEEKTQLFTALERVETTLTFVHSDVKDFKKEIHPKVNKNTNHRFTTYGLVGFISLGMAIYKFFGGRP